MTIRLWFYLFLLGLSLYTHAASHHPQAFLQQVAGTKDEGKQIYQHYCANCHDHKPLINVGAPRQEEVSDWKPRLLQTIDVLFAHTNEGLNAMPARGGCFECTDWQLVLAIVEMVPKNDKKDILNKLTAHIKYK